MKRFAVFLAWGLLAPLLCVAQNAGPSPPQPPGLTPAGLPPIAPSAPLATPQASPSVSPPAGGVGWHLTTSQESQSHDAARPAGSSMGFTFIAGALNLGLGIYALISFFEIREPGDPLLRVARNTALLMLLFEVAVLALQPGAIKLQPTAIVLLILYDAILFLKLLIAVYVGIHLWQRSGTDYWGLAMWKADRTRMLAVSLAAIAVFVVYSRGLFFWLHPSQGWALKSLTSSSGEFGMRATAIALLVSADYAFVEELIYRGCFQPIVANWSPKTRGTPAASWRAIVIIAAVWTLGHAGSLAPDWVKFLQMFPMGLFLGWWYRKAGLIGSLLVHLGFNITMVLIPGHSILLR